MANPNLIYTKGDGVAYFYEEEFDVEVLVAEGRKVKANDEASRAKPEYAAYQIAYSARALARRISEAATRANSGEWSESATTILGEINSYVQNKPDDRLVYIFMSSLDETSIKRETKRNKEKIVKMGGEEATYVEEAWTIVGLDVVTPREKGTGFDGVPDAAGYAIARTVEALAVDENRGRVGNQRGGGGGGIPHMVLLGSGRVCVGSMKRSEESDSEESAAEGYSSEPLGTKKRKLN